ncbi:hypothetical protein DPMN_020174 [Dreissena polymorpha]|uniref:Uncharacterized protein n=1 Tax=Dreissena polymorpha TaxID=45954 RepID=A0A9D4NJW7_DREPO|nr:hypothetical protein DPMN_020174 [Dreissena polymorpha]
MPSESHTSSSEAVLVADDNNYKVKLLNQQYRVGWAIGHVAVAMSNKELAKGRKLKLQHSCEGIAHNQGDLYICSGSALYKFTLSGELVCRLYEDSSADFTVQCCVVYFECPLTKLIDRVLFRIQHSF